METEHFHQRVAVVVVPAVEPFHVKVVRVVGEWIRYGLAALAGDPDVVFLAGRGLIVTVQGEAEVLSFCLCKETWRMSRPGSALAPVASEGTKARM